MILSGHWTSRGDVFQAGLQSLRWLVETQKAEAGHFAPIGCNGLSGSAAANARDSISNRSKPMQRFPPASKLSLSRMTNIGSARRDTVLSGSSVAMTWESRSTIPVQGGCRDALHQDRVSQNQGAESSLSHSIYRLPR